MKQSETVAALFKALAQAQAEMPPAPKDAKNDHLRNTYATLGSIIATAQPVLARHGLGFSQMAGADEPGFMALTTRIFHESGEWIEDTMRAAVPQSKLSEIQAAGSVLSYMRRYSLAAALGMSTEDDDGQAASAPKPAQAPRQAPPRPSAAPAPAPAPQKPASGPTLSAAQAQTLHKRLGAILAGTDWQGMDKEFAGDVLGFKVGSFADLTFDEAKRVQEAAETVPKPPAQEGAA